MLIGTNVTAIQSDESRYRLLVDAITDYAIYMLDIEGYVTSWNTGAQRFKGYEPDEIIGQHFSRFYQPADIAAGVPVRALARAASEGRFEQEGWRVRKDGGRFWAHVIIDPILTPEGELIGYAKITRDLTERRAAEEALRRSEEQFRLLVEGVTDYALYMLDPDGFVSSWNAGAQRIKGYTREEIVGSHFSTFYTREDRDAGDPDRALSTAAREDRFEKEGWRVRKDGTRFWAHVVIDSLRSPDGQLIGFAKITRDITERMTAQQSLEVAREALYQSQKMEAIGQLTGGIAHDFNNLLGAVLGSLELVRKRQPFDPRTTPLLENAIQGAQRGAVLTQRMLAFARKQDLKLEAVNISGLTRGTIAFLERTLGPGVEVMMDFPISLPMVLTDPAQLESALINLAVNARDAMPGGGTITITAAVAEARQHASLSPGTYVRLTLSDDGEGMDAETLRRSLEPFFTTKGVGKGTGLGLSMVHGLTVQSGGALSLQSQPGEGTTVDLWLPVAACVEAAVEASADLGPAPDQGRDLRILAVDDDNLVLINTAAMLEDLGYTVVMVGSAQEGLRALQDDQHFDLVVSDEVMPRMTGSEFANAARQLRPDLPVIIATGFAGLAGEAIASGLPRLAKPFSQAQLAQLIIETVQPGPPG